MIARQAILVRRELWEHRSIPVALAVVALLVSLLAITGEIAVSAFGRGVDIALLSASNLGPRERSAAVGIAMFGISCVFAATMCVLTIFYSLDALFAERKDRSILFWRSMPSTDSETVLSKLLVAAVAIPLLTLLAIVLTHLVVLTVTSIWVDVRGADAWYLIWSATPFVANWVATLVVLLALPLWLAPFIGWFLFVSAFARRSPFLVAFLPILILPMLEKNVAGTTLFAQAFFVRTGTIPLFRGLDTEDLFSQEGEKAAAAAQAVEPSLLPLLDLPRFLLSPSLWLGLVVCAVLIVAAIYVRRYRDDS